MLTVLKKNSLVHAHQKLSQMYIDRLYCFSSCTSEMNVGLHIVFRVGLHAQDACPTP